jgi:hypothetical protein
MRRSKAPHPYSLVFLNASLRSNLCGRKAFLRDAVNGVFVVAVSQDKSRFLQNPITCGSI